MLSKIKNHGKENFFFEFENSTKAFKNIILRYKKNNMKSKKLGNKKLLLKNIQSKIEKAQSEEKEKDYMIKEVRRNILIRDKIISSFGTKAINHYDDTKNIDIRIKIDKSKLFNPLIDYNSNLHNCYGKINNRHKNNSHKVLNLPKISYILNIKKEKKPININTFDNNNISLIKVNEYSFDNKNETSEVETNKSNDNTSLRKIILSSKNSNNGDYKTKENNLNQCNTSKNIGENSRINSTSNLFPYIYNTPLTSERNYSFNNNKNNNIALNKKKKCILDLNYLDDIENIREKLLLEEKKKQKFFENNMYGCDKYKLKFNYIKEKYFC